MLVRLTRVRALSLGWRLFSLAFLLTSRLARLLWLLSSLGGRLITALAGLLALLLGWLLVSLVQLLLLLLLNRLLADLPLGLGPGLLTGRLVASLGLSGLLVLLRLTIVNGGLLLLLDCRLALLLYRFLLLLLSWSAFGWLLSAGSLGGRLSSLRLGVLSLTPFGLSLLLLATLRGLLRSLRWCLGSRRLILLDLLLALLLHRLFLLLLWLFALRLLLSTSLLRRRVLSTLGCSRDP